MGLKEAEEFKQAYLEWLRGNIEVKDMGGHVRITTPFLDRYNDYLALYVKEEKGCYTLTDDGHIINELILSGCDLSSRGRSGLLNEIIAGFGVQRNRDELTVTASSKDFPQKKHMLLQAMMAVDDMFMTVQSRVASLFFEEISDYLYSHDVRYSEAVQLAGVSGLAHNVDFMIPASRTAPERMLKGINTPNRSRIQTTLFAWNDVRQARRSELKLLVFLNDQKSAVNESLIGALENYQAVPILWSKKDEYLGELVS